ncbi:MAG: hypothetical protein AB9866_29620 [Syntrophobacteraceae bacterium]
MERRFVRLLRQSLAVLSGCIAILVAGFIGPEAQAARCVVVTFELDYYQLRDLTGTHPDTTTPNFPVTVQLCEDAMTQYAPTHYVFNVGSQFNPGLDVPPVPGQVASQTPTEASSVDLLIKVEDTVNFSFFESIQYYKYYSYPECPPDVCIESWSYIHKTNLYVNEIWDVPTEVPSDIISFLYGFFKNRKDEQAQYSGSEWVQYSHVDDPPGSDITHETLIFEAHDYNAIVTDVKLTGAGTFPPHLFILLQ